MYRDVAPGEVRMQNEGWRSGQVREKSPLQVMHPEEAYPGSTTLSQEEIRGSRRGTCGNTFFGMCTCTNKGPSMEFLGEGVGDYVAETKYRYVGQGKGDMAFNPQAQQQAPPPQPDHTKTIFGVTTIMILIGIVIWVVVSSWTEDDSLGLTSTFAPTPQVFGAASARRGSDGTTLTQPYPVVFQGDGGRVPAAAAFACKVVVPSAGQVPVRWSREEEAWCCEHKGLGCPAQYT